MVELLLGISILVVGALALAALILALGVGIQHGKLQAEQEKRDAEEKRFPVIRITEPELRGMVRVMAREELKSLEENRTN